MHARKRSTWPRRNIDANAPARLATPTPSAPRLASRCRHQGFGPDDQAKGPFSRGRTRKHGPWQRYVAAPSSSGRGCGSEEMLSEGWRGGGKCTIPPYENSAGPRCMVGIRIAKLKRDNDEDHDATLLPPPWLGPMVRGAGTGRWTRSNHARLCDLRFQRVRIFIIESSGHRHSVVLAAQRHRGTCSGRRGSRLHAAPGSHPLTSLHGDFSSTRTDRKNPIAERGS
jgi:hypothetical protein